jgi:hypothetical protein
MKQPTVMAGLDPATHTAAPPHAAHGEHARPRHPLTHPTHGPAWMAGPSPAMTGQV